MKNSVPQAVRLASNHPNARARSFPDFTVHNHGSLFLFYPQSDAARAWLNEHCGGEDHQYFGPALVVEPRYVANLLVNARNDGINV